MGVSPSNNDVNRRIADAFQQTPIKGQINDKSQKGLGAKIKLVVGRIVAYLQTGEMRTNGSLLKIADSRIRDLKIILKNEKESIGEKDKDIVRRGVADMRAYLNKLQKADQADSEKPSDKMKRVYEKEYDADGIYIYEHETASRKEAFEMLEGDLKSLENLLDEGSS